MALKDFQLLIPSYVLGMGEIESAAWHALKMSSVTGYWIPPAISPEAMQGTVGFLLCPKDTRGGYGIMERRRI